MLPPVYEALQMQAREKPEKPGFTVLMRSFVGTNPFDCNLCKDRLRFTGSQPGTHASELLLERLCGMDIKRWLRMPELDQCGVLSRNRRNFRSPDFTGGEGQSSRAVSHR